jgi:hypothetical protein
MEAAFGFVENVRNYTHEGRRACHIGSKIVKSDSSMILAPVSGELEISFPLRALLVGWAK